MRGARRRVIMSRDSCPGCLVAGYCDCRPKIFGRGVPVLSLGLILIPLLSRGRRGRVNRMGCWMLVGAGSLMFFASSLGCGGGGNSGGEGGSGSQPQSYTLTVTATSGSLAHTTTLTLTVE